MWNFTRYSVFYFTIALNVELLSYDGFTDPSARGDLEEIHLRKTHPGEAGEILHEEQLGPGADRHGAGHVAQRSFTLKLGPPPPGGATAAATSHEPRLKQHCHQKQWKQQDVIDGHLFAMETDKLNNNYYRLCCSVF